ncbi:MAG: diguanylate cyclase [Candidatus Gastranaerophilales bacterium]|nr:diguanylate cyclase [Candidatus Gastranaerophilales bacterium]
MSAELQENSLAQQVSQLKEEFEEMGMLLEISKLINQTSDVSALTSKFMNYIEKKFNSKDTVVFLKEDIRYYVAYQNNPKMSSHISFENTQEGIWKIIQAGKAFEIVNSNNQNIYNNFFENNELSALNAYAWLPLVNNGDIFGIISLGAKGENENYSQKDLNLFNKIIDYIAPVLNKLRLQSLNEQNLQELQKTIHNISILYNIGQAMNFIDDLKGLLKVILEKALNTLDAEKGSLMLYDYSNNDLAIKVVFGLNDKEHEERINEGLIACTRIRAGEGIAGTVFSQKKAIITNLGSNDPRFKQAIGSNVRSMLCIPLIVKSECIGVINITNKKGGKLFNQHDLDFMEALANQAAIAIDNSQLYELATKDGLTKLYIYRHFHSLLDNEIKRSARYQHPISLLMIDLDDFKSINDTYGHQTGDQILKEVAAVISGTCRKIDMPSRYGGEEFAVILPETPPENACKISERLRIKVEQIRVTTPEGKVISASASFGIAGFPQDAKTQTDLIEFADKALYYSKEKGKNCVSIYNQGNMQKYISEE